MMKRIFAVIMAAVMAFSMTACSKGSDLPESGTVVQPTSDVLVRSDFNGLDTFTNNFTGVVMTMPGDWYVANDSELVALFFGDSVTSGEFANWTSSDFAKQQVIPDFVVTDLANGNNINILYENVAADSDITAEEYVDLCEIVFAAAGSSVANKGIVQLCGMEFATIAAKGETDGVPMEQYQAVRRFGDWMMIVTATDMTGLGENSFWNMFG